MKIHWLRVVLGALLLEFVLFVVLVPISFINATLFLVAVPVGVFAFGYLVTSWLLYTGSGRISRFGTSRRLGIRLLALGYGSWRLIGFPTLMSRAAGNQAVLTLL